MFIHDAIIEVIDKHSRRGERVLNVIAQTEESVATSSINPHKVLYKLQRFGKPKHGPMNPTIASFGKRDVLLSARLELEVEKRVCSAPPSTANLGYLSGCPHICTKYFSSTLGSIHSSLPACVP